MTWHLGPRLKARVGLLSVVLAAGCGSSGGRRATIDLLVPEDKAELTIEDDKDPDAAGVQYEVRAKAQNIRRGTTMLLVMPGENTTFFTDVDDEGLVVFENATLPPGPHTFHISNAVGSVTSADYSYTLKTLVISTPRDGAGIAFGDDADPERDGLQVNVTVKAYAIDGNEDIELWVDGAVAGEAVSPDAKGAAVFRGVTLATGVHRLKAIAGNVESSETVVSVNSACASVTYLSPELGTGDRVRLPGGSACPPVGEDYVYDVVISTDAGDGREVELTVNNTTKQRTSVQGSVARFDAVVFNRRMTANELSVTVQGAGDVTCAAVPFPKDIFVDCVGSDCAIGSPVPYSGDDAHGDPAFYLNASMLHDGGFDIRVDSDTGVIGQQVELIVDGRDGKNVLKADTGPNASRVSATFSKVRLAAGPHTIEARCRDGSGNATESGEVKWTVDVDACSVEIDAPAADTRILLADDLDSDDSNGVQVELRATIEGSDCVESRAAVCNPDDGVVNASFEVLESSSMTGEITLESAAEQRVCVETKDRAGNTGIGSVPVHYRSEVPKVQIESPVDLTMFNAAGNDGKTMDSDSATPVCNADFRILCSELGGTVLLRHADENGPMFASGTCEARADGDAELPAGYVGRAKLDDVVFLPAGQDNTTVIATLTITGASDRTLVGKSDVIALTGWCESPPVTLFPGCPDPQLELPSDGGQVEVPVLQAIFNGTIAARAPREAALTVTNPAGGTIYSDTIDLVNGTYRFTNVSLGNVEQEVEATIVLTDSYANTTTVTCATTLVSDLPLVQFSSPANGATIGPNDGCDPGVPDKFGVPVSLELDQLGMRELGYSVNAGSRQDVTITGTDLTLCIPVNDGGNTITAQLDSTVSVGVSKPSIEIDVDVVELVEPGPGAVLLEADDACDAGFGAQIFARVAPAFEGSAVTISSGANRVTAAVSGGEIDTCLPLPLGPSTITLSLDGKAVTRSVAVSVVTESPTHAIALTDVMLPDSANYRTGPIRLAWATPAQDFNGQLTAYQLRCATSSIAGSAGDQEKEDWWVAARDLPLSGTVTPPATSAAVGIRIGESLHCVLRGTDAADQFTPIPDSTIVSYPFREVRVDVTEPHSMGYALAAVGDVNDDNINDVLVGGTGRAYLYLGKADGLSAKPDPTAPDVTFIGASGVPQYDFGSRVASLGDVNGDGENDFAIAHPTFTASSPMLNVTGATYLFYGRKSGDDWPSTVDLTATNPSACAADVCFVGDVASEFLGFGLAPAGDFNGDGRGDIALGAPARALPGTPSVDAFAGRLYVLLGRQFEGSGGTRPTQFWNVGIRLPSGEPLGFYLDGTGPTGMDATSSSQLGTAVVSVGNVDGVAGADLLLNAAGNASFNPAISSKLYYLSGRPHNGAAPNLRAIANSALVLKDTGPTNAFAVRLSPLRNWYDDTQSGVPDVAVFQTASSAFWVYLGDENGSSERFANDTRITVTGPGGAGLGNGGLSVSRGYNPSISSVSRSDLDADGLDDLCVGTATLGPIYVFYGNTIADNLSSNQLDYTTASQINPTARTGTTSRTVQPVGDVTGDGALDLVVGEPNANSNTGGITVLY